MLCTFPPAVDLLFFGDMQRALLLGMFCHSVSTGRWLHINETMYIGSKVEVMQVKAL